MLINGLAMRLDIRVVHITEPVTTRDVAVASIRALVVKRRECVV
jgi:hypothetical protein